jgi:hypothetical protein
MAMGGDFMIGVCTAGRPQVHQTFRVRYRHRGAADMGPRIPIVGRGHHRNSLESTFLLHRTTG